MDNNELIPMEEEENLLTLTDENGNEETFEYLDVIEYEGKEYLFLLPAEEESSEIVVLEIEPVISTMPLTPSTPARAPSWVVSSTI